jgi:hypothetical protein
MTHIICRICVDHGAYLGWLLECLKIKCGWRAVESRRGALNTGPLPNYIDLITEDN